MPSLTARVISWVLLKTSIYKKRYTGGPDFLDIIKTARAEKPQLPTAAMHAKFAVSVEELDGRQIWRMAPTDKAPTAELLYYHGGGYVYSPADVHWKFYAHLVETYGIAITAPLYPLAPENSATTTVDWAMAAYRQFLSQHDGVFILGGDSAGAGLASVVAQQARDTGLRQANGILLICPWLDGTGSHPDQPSIEERDCILTLSGLQNAARLYARDLPVTDPMVSPINGDWNGLPPILCFGGGDDILLPDARALKAKLPAITYVEQAGLMHDWPIFFLRESREAQRQMARFATDHAPL
jgi:epsilon-lactone hydrolase